MKKITLDLRIIVFMRINAFFSRRRCTIHLLSHRGDSPAGRRHARRARAEWGTRRRRQEADQEDPKQSQAPLQLQTPITSLMIYTD